ncbi:MAG: hypothetical protein HKM02_03720 [Pseudomonadales bacterium]|nr:hypothetical protein [Pseudomonadales bacterium]
MDSRLWWARLSTKKYVTRPQVPVQEQPWVETLLFQGILEQDRVNGVLRYFIKKPDELLEFYKKNF